MSATAGSAAADSRPDAGHTPAPERRRFPGLGPNGLAIVAAVTLIITLNSTVRILVTAPFAYWLEVFFYEFVRHAFIGMAILLAVVWARSRIPSKGIARYAAAATIVVLAAALALLAIVGWDSRGTFGLDEPDASLAGLALDLGPILFRFAFIGLVIALAWLYACAEAEHAAAVERCAIDAERMDRETAEARLQMLEAQIEPHFLFNTLANVKRLYETDRAAGAWMLRNLKDYLAVALPQMRAAASTLGREIDHVRAYLNIQQIRMGRRLDFSIDLPDALRDAALPPLMVLTLVENAIKHGLAPLPEGGRIEVRAFLAEGRLNVRVADSGRGFAKSGGGGTGLANIRARLASTHGSKASLTLAHHAPQGIVATLALPHEPVAIGPDRR